MSITLVAKLKVEDYTKLEATYANRESERVAAGLETKLYRDMDDPTGAVKGSLPCIYD